MVCKFIVGAVAVGQRDKVPKWSKAAFQDKFNIMKGKLENGEEAAGSKKFAELDSSLARLQRKLREGSALEAGQRVSNRVSGRRTLRLVPEVGRFRCQGFGRSEKLCPARAADYQA